MVLRMVHGGKVVLFGADVGLNGQKELTEIYGKGLKADLIKIPHHANEVFDPVFEAFLQAVDPKFAVLTIGPNPAGAPDAGMIEMYQRHVHRILRTDRHGTITVKSDGHTLEIETERK